jgi:selenocysteine lyase/cysteine desulfurase
MYQKFYSDFLKAHKNQIHLAAHSHHFWPDSAKKGHLESYEKAVLLSDKKWEYVFETLIPEVKKIIASQIHFTRPQDISFASNTHELITKVISSYFEQKEIKILTSTCEFHSVARQLKRFEEDKKFQIDYLDPEDDSFENTLETKLSQNNYDIILLSHVFYNSGKILSHQLIQKIIKLKGKASFLLDAYHGFCAVETDIAPYENDLYYLAGGYKYAQAGEGMCFMTIPSNCQLRPQITGWFASFSTLEKTVAQTRTNYDDNGMRFWGSTQEMSAFYRFRSVWKHFHQENIKIKDFHHYIKKLQKSFLENNPLADQFIEKNLEQCGQFLTLDLATTEKTQKTHFQLLNKGILTDFRGTRLRFGFAPYLSHNDILAAKQALSSLK